MKNILRGLVCLLFSVALLGCGDSYSWHQKLTVEVQTPEGLVSGSSVVEIHWSTGSDVNYLPGATNAGSRVKGEATVVEIASGRYLFALLGDSQSLAPEVFPETRKQGVKAFGPLLQATRKSITVPRAHYPMLVTFKDNTDPKTVQEVDSENLATTFGSGVSLKRITLEITDEDLTKGKLEGVLAWWCDLRKKRARLNGKTGSIGDNELSNNLGSGNFKTEKCQ